MKKFLFVMIFFMLVIVTPLMAVHMKTFGGLGIGWNSDSLTLRLTHMGDEIFKAKGADDYPYYELSIGEEFSFDKYNGLQIYTSGGVFQEINNNLNLNKGIFTIGTNYVLESGKFFNGLELALLTGFDMGARFSSIFGKSDGLGIIFQTKDSNDPDRSITKISFIMDCNLGLRLKYEWYAISWNIKFPLFSSNTPIEVNAYAPNKVPLMTGEVISYPITTTLSFIFFL
ncbi:hypothetical protein BKH42_03280 [Helicobacter sp. 13S00482-2]|uniref:hypothetical protein n=1 Tax=Helicobacter sp. 13S00482-2 TaxID=1476200 RepID=UPI000BA4EAA3|nr:hypothetical protein [Helicobacter sp. 13S00482-2]PAF54001.1 hypothetical protein BKH42_03280 [Helicobacter sp. 13S00482-2]